MPYIRQLSPSGAAKSDTVALSGKQFGYFFNVVLPFLLFSRRSVRLQRTLPAHRLSRLVSSVYILYHENKFPQASVFPHASHLSTQHGSWLVFFSSLSQDFLRLNFHPTVTTQRVLGSLDVLVLFFDILVLLAVSDSFFEFLGVRYLTSVWVDATLESPSVCRWLIHFAARQQVFHDIAYKAKDRQDLLAGIEEFLDEVIVLPPGEWDPEIRIEPPKSLPSSDKRSALIPTA